MTNNEMNEEEASARLANMLNERKVYKIRYTKSDKTTHTYVVCKPEDMKGALRSGTGFVFFDKIMSYAKRIGCIGVSWGDGLVMPKDGAKNYCLVDFSIPVNKIEEVDEVKL
ncbi:MULTISPECIES: hypothetical protein [Lactobacillus]|uniref:hypothetical protein n=1 Tax=Lactobacillus TaxID=1578 RepID=UPI0018A0104E|nr:MULTISPECIES: hypothetical protein [Lactobacillus]